jgi:hypothetical protein
VSALAISQRLRELHDSYADRVNRLVEEGREDLALEVADAYTEEAIRLIVASGGSADHGRGEPRYRDGRAA